VVLFILSAMDDRRASKWYRAEGRSRIRSSPPSSTALPRPGSARVHCASKALLSFAGLPVPVGRPVSVEEFKSHITKFQQKRDARHA
jgi:hypothetical protein